MDRYLVPDPDRALDRLDVRQPVAVRRAGVDSQLGLAQRLGERIWVDRDKVELPEQFRSRAASLVANAYSTIGMGLLALGLIDLNLLAVITGILITHGGKAWYLDRVQLLFAQMKDRKPEYASWDY
jgi:hypothetical protein